MITVALSASIGSPIERVWRALVDPAERTLWDDRILGEVELVTSPRRRGRAAARGSTRSLESPKRNTARSGVDDVIRTTNWRFRLGGIPLVMRDRLLEVDGHERLTSRISIGSMQFDQTLTLYREDEEDDATGPRTRLGMKLVANNSIAVIGEVVQRLDVQKLVIEYVDATLRQVQKHCESEA